MSDFLTDEEIDSMFELDDAPPTMEQAAAALAPMPQAPEPVPLYSLQLAQAPAPTSPEDDAQRGVLIRKYAGVPGWAWGLLGVGVVGSGYLYYASRKPKKNGDGDDEPAPNIGDIISKTLGAGSSANDASRGWAPSRSAFAESLERYFAKKGMSDHVTVWVDAEDAKSKGGMKFVSPLVNVQVKGANVKVDEALKRHCRREGLNPVQHQDGSIGMYAHSSKRGKEWEEYIDALRDEGQSV